MYTNYREGPGPWKKNFPLLEEGAMAQLTEHSTYYVNPSDPALGANMPWMEDLMEKQRTVTPSWPGKGATGLHPPATQVK